MTKIYVGNLNYITDEVFLEKVFLRFGSIVSVKVIKDSETNTSKGYAFIEFEKEGDASKAVAGMNGRELDGRKINVSFATSE